MKRKQNRKLRRLFKKNLIFDPKECEIIAIKRKSDGHIFKVGDKIKKMYPNKYQNDISLMFDKFNHDNCKGTIKI